MISNDWTQALERSHQEDEEGLPLGFEALDIGSLLDGQSSVASNIRVTYEGKLWSRYAEEMRVERVKTNIPQFKKGISGGWRIVSSENCKKYLEKRAAAEIYDVSFETADLYFHFDGDTIKIHEQLEAQKYHSRCFKLSEPKVFGKIACMTYFFENSLKTVYILDDNNGEEEEEERCIENGKLKVIVKRGGVKCVRMYQRVDGVVPMVSGAQPKTNQNFERLSGIYSALWEDINNPGGTTSIKIIGDKFIRKNGGTEYIEKFGVKGASGVVTYVDGDKIVQINLDQNDLIAYRSIYSIENDHMVYTGLAPGTQAMRYVHKRIGEAI